MFDALVTSPTLPCAEKVHTIKHTKNIFLQLFEDQKPLNSYLSNSEDPDEMPNNVVFHQDLRCLLRLKSEKNYNIIQKIITFDLSISRGIRHF